VPDSTRFSDPRSGRNKLPPCKGTFASFRWAFTSRSKVLKSRNHSVSSRPCTNSLRASMRLQGFGAQAAQAARCPLPTQSVLAAVRLASQCCCTLSCPKVDRPTYPGSRRRSLLARPTRQSLRCPHAINMRSGDLVTFRLGSDPMRTTGRPSTVTWLQQTLGSVRPDGTSPAASPPVNKRDHAPGLRSLATAIR